MSRARKLWMRKKRRRRRSRRRSSDRRDETVRGNQGFFTRRNKADRKAWLKLV